MTVRPPIRTGLGTGAFLALLLLGGPVAAQQSPECVVLAVEGSAIALARGAGRTEVQPGLGIGRGGIIRTGADERVTLECQGGLTVVIGPDTEIAVSGVLDGGTRPFGLRLIDGIAGFLLSDEGSGGVQVTTPSAVAAVRSTEWAMQVEGKASAVFARDGTVFTFGANEAFVRLEPGDGVDVTPDGTLGAVTRWGQARIDRFGALLGGDW
jgi:hypothetical protein